MSLRTERDLLGERELPSGAPYGIHTLRALENFPLSGRPVHTGLARAYGDVKLACARTNRALGVWADDPAKGDAIEAACAEKNAIAHALFGTDPLDPAKMYDEYAAAVRVGRVGHLLALADTTKPVRVPDAFAEHKKDLERLSVRIESLGLRNPFSPANLKALSPSQVREQLQLAKKSGLLDDGATWTFKGAAARTFVSDISRQLDQTRDVERRLEDKLIARKGSP